MASASAPSSAPPEERLTRVLRPVLGEVRGISGLRALSGGAVQETWAFDADVSGRSMPLILRRARGRLREERVHGIGIEAEADVVCLAAAGGVPAPRVHVVLSPEDELGRGFVMDRIEGETIPRRILRDAAFAGLRETLAAQCGAVLADIHRLDYGAIDELEHDQPRDRLKRIRADYEALRAPSAVFELAFRWLEQNMLPDLPVLGLVHGDFRIGNLLVGPDRIRAILDWEGAHVGDPHEDLGYIAVTSWRFGEIDRPVGGFGSRQALYDAYEARSGVPVDRARARFWEIAFTLNWGIQCGQMADQFLSGSDSSVERGTIGRRRSETELDLLRILDGGADA